MILPLDHDSSIPLFVQIVDSVRWKIAVGELRAGESLPPARSASSTWGVNRHTIGRAYRELLQAGLVQREGRSLLVARTPAARRASPETSTFIDDVVQQSAAQGLTVFELIDLLRNRAGLTSGSRQPVIVECTDDQCDDLSRAVRGVSGLSLESLLLHEIDALPEAPIIGTLFHQEEMLQRWPDRSADMHFVTATLDPAIGAIVRHLSGESSPKNVLLVVGEDRVAGTNLAKDVASILGDGCRVSLSVLPEESDSLEELVHDQIALLTPLVWRDTPPSVRGMPNVVRLRYAVTADDLARLCRIFEWRLQDQPAPAIGRSSRSHPSGELQICDPCHSKP